MMPPFQYTGTAMKILVIDPGPLFLQAAGKECA